VPLLPLVVVPLLVVPLLLVVSPLLLLVLVVLVVLAAPRAGQCCLHRLLLVHLRHAGSPSSPLPLLLVSLLVALLLLVPLVSLVPLVQLVVLAVPRAGQRCLHRLLLVHLHHAGSPSSPLPLVVGVLVVVALLLPLVLHAGQCRPHRLLLVHLRHRQVRVVRRPLRAAMFLMKTTTWSRRTMVTTVRTQVMRTTVKRPKSLRTRMVSCCR
jgi:hypothetical protein